MVVNRTCLRITRDFEISFENDFDVNIKWHSGYRYVLSGSRKAKWRRFASLFADFLGRKWRNACSKLLPHNETWKRFYWHNIWVVILAIALIVKLMSFYGNLFVASLNKYHAQHSGDLLYLIYDMRSPATYYTPKTRRARPIFAMEENS